MVLTATKHDGMSAMVDEMAQPQPHLAELDVHIGAPDDGT